MAADVKIDIAAEFTGKKAFRQAETATDKMSKNVKKLAGGLLLAFGTRQILAFGKASVRAFVEDDKAATALGQTLKNLNLAYGSNIGTVNGFISRLEMETGVLDDELRPAMDRLLRATGDVTKSQELLNLALDIAAGTGKSVTQVSQSLQKAFLGQNQALGRLGVGLSKAELESSSFEEIQQRLSELFAGQATAAVDTYAGSLARLTIAGNNAKETIGKGLVDALKIASGSTSTDELITKINNASEAMGNFIREAGYFIAITKQIFDFKNLSWTFQDPKAFKGLGNISMTVSSQDTQKADAAAKKAAEATAAAAAKKAAEAASKLAAAQKKTLKSQQDALKLSKAKAIFDLQKIQIEAALKGKISEEDKLRLKLMLAIEEQNIELVDKYTKLLDEAQKKTKELADTLTAIKATEALNPFSGIEAGAITATAAIQAMIDAVSLSNQTAQQSFEMGISQGNTIAEAISGANYAAQGEAAFAEQVAAVTLTDAVAAASFTEGIAQGNSIPEALSGANYASQAAASMPAPVTNIEINVTGALDPEAVARQIDDLLTQSYERGAGGAGAYAV